MSSRPLPAIMSDHTDQTTETKAVLGTEMRVAHQRRAGIGRTSAIGPSILRAIGTQAAVASSGTLRAATVLAVSFLRNSARLDGMERVENERKDQQVRHDLGGTPVEKRVGKGLTA